jgi:arylsulfatase A-like enzyme
LPDAPEVRRDMADYYGEIERLDRYVGGVLDALDRSELNKNTLVVLLSDNGRPFPREKVYLFDSGIRTPLLMRFPEHVPAGATCDALASSVDLAATFMKVAGAETWPAPSRSLTPLWRDPHSSVRDFIVAEQNWHDYEARGRAIRDARFKYIRNEYADLSPSPPADVVKSTTHQTMRLLAAAGKLSAQQSIPFQAQRAPEEFYDLATDPQELHNAVADPRYGAELTRLRKELDAWQTATLDRAPSERTPDGFDRTSGDKLTLERNP